MANPVTDEINDLVAQANARREAEEDDDEGQEEPAATRRRRTRKANGSKKEEAEAEAESTEQISVEDNPPSPQELLVKQLPKPAENIKTLGSMYAKYGVGENPEFQIQVWRTYPKIAPGGVKFDGFYDTYATPMSEEMLQVEYGGGTFRVKVVGPHPSQFNMPKHYDSIQVELAGPPKYERLPRALQGTMVDKKDDGEMPRMQGMSHENPKLAEAALKMIGGQADADRAERHRLENRLEEVRRSSSESVQPIIDAERRRADDVMRVQEERRAERETMFERQRLEERGRLDDERRRIQMEHGSRRSIGEELASLASSGLLGREDTSSKEMFTQVLEKHRVEMDAITTRQTQFIDSIRSGHMSEVAALRDAHRREMEAEREASRSREGRIDERLLAEREERRRDQERFKEQVDERDRQWRDRMDQSKETIEGAWNSRHQMSISTYESRIQWLQQEIDRVKSDHDVLKMKTEDRGDVSTQLLKMREMQELVKELSPQALPTTAASSGGIGLGGGDDWKNALAEGVSERLPQIAQALFGGGAAGAPQPQLTEGQILHADPSTGQPFPHGPMVIVRDPNSGQLAMSPKAALDAHQRALHAQQSGRLLQPAQGRPRPQVMPDPEKVRRRSKVAAVPNFAEGMPKLIPPWEAEHGDFSPSEPRPEPRMSTRSRQDPDASPEPMEMNAQERQAIKVIAKLVHESVMEADEPEEFVAKVMNIYDPNVIRGIVGGYTTEQIAKGIRQVEANSAGATPGGQAFIRDAFSQLRRALSD